MYPKCIPRGTFGGPGIQVARDSGSHFPRDTARLDVSGVKRPEARFLTRGIEKGGNIEVVDPFSFALLSLAGAVDFFATETTDAHDVALASSSPFARHWEGAAGAGGGVGSVA